jgi:hypothetical protein
MAAITVRPEPIVRDGDVQTVSAVVSGVTDNPYRIWYRIPCGYEIDDVSLGHALAISVINQAMALGRDVFIDGTLTHGLVANLEEYQHVWSAWRPRTFRVVAIRSRALVEEESYRPQRGVILPFSGGLDSAYSASLLAQSGRLRALFTIQGLDVALDAREQWGGALAGMRAMARSLDVPLLVGATNWRVVSARLPGFMGHLPVPVAMSALLSRAFGETGVSSYFPYDDLKLPEETNPMSDPLLGRPGFPVRHHGAWAHRIEKVEAIASWPEALQHLRACGTATPAGTACGECNKCVRTRLLFHALGKPVPPALGGRPPSLDQLESLAVRPIAPSDLREALDAARRRGVTEDWMAVAERRLVDADRRLTLADEVDLLRRRFDYMIGGDARSAPMRFLRRVLRALRGKTDASRPF